MAIHVVPVNDLREHDTVNTSLCECGPRVILEYDEIIVIHAAYDGREGVEIANEILNADADRR